MRPAGEPMSRWRAILSGEFGAFAQKGDKEFFVLALVGAVFLAPFGVNNFIQGRPALGATTLAVVAWFALHAAALYRGRRLLPPVLVILPVLAALGYVMVGRAELGLFWAYPAVLLFHFVLERRLANLCNAAIVLMAAPLAHAAFGLEIALRVAVTLALTILFANIFSHLAERQRRREAEQERALEVERERLGLLVHATQAGFSDWDAEANVVIYSERFKEMLGYPRDADTSAWPPFFELMHPEDRPGVQEEFRAMLRQKRAPGLQQPGQALDYRLRRADGSYLWVHAESLAQVDQTLRIKRFITSYQDIGKFRAQEERLREQAQALVTEQRRLELALRAGDLGILDWDGVTRTAYYSRRFKELLGHPGEADTSGWPEYFDMIHPEDRPRVQERFRKHILEERGEAHETIRYRLRRADGGYTWIEAVGVSVRDARGYATRFIASIRDIGEQRAAEEARLTEQRRLDLVVRAAQVGIVDWDGRSHATYYSPRFREILGHAPDADTSGWPDYFKVLIHPEDRSRITTRWRSFILGKGPEGPLGEYYAPEEYRLLRADGSYVWVQSSGIAVRDAQGFVTRWIAAITDVTEQRAQEEALRESVRLREEVERMSRHDLKTPLNSVIAASRLLREGGHFDDEDRELLGTVERAGYRILNMVNLSLDLYRMEQGSYRLNPRAVDLADVARKAADDLESQASSKQVAVAIHAEGAVAARAEELLCYSMLANLLKNAIEAAPEGTQVSIRLESGGGQARMSVHNAGEVPGAVRARFFDKYATAGKSAGLGLGTYSARLIARAQGGDIALESSAAGGTTVAVTLPAAGPGDAAPEGAPAPARAERSALPELAPMRVLVVDDDEFNRLMLRRLLPAPPLELEMAVNGRAALDAAAREWPDAVLLDLEMPVMDGYEAAARLRAMQEAGGLKRCLIVAISSNDDRATMERALACGCDDYLVKPAPRETLWKLLAGVAGNRREAGFLESPSGSAEAVLVDPDLEGALPGFLGTRRDMLAELPRALDAADRSRFKRLAHQLAGSFALYGFGWAAAQCRGLERDALSAAPGELRARAAAVAAYLDTVPVRFKAR